MKRFLLPALLGLACMALPAMALPPVDVAIHADEGGFRDVRLSPTGEYLAVTIPSGDHTVFAVLRRDSRAVVGNFQFPKGVHVADFWWANAGRVLIAVAERFGSRDYPSATGELYAMNVDGGERGLLVGWRVALQPTGSRLLDQKREGGAVFAWPVDLLPDDDRHVLVSVSPFSREPQTRVERMNVYTGRRTQVASVPVTRASFLTDNTGAIRFANGARSDNLSQLYHRADDGAPWQLLNDERQSGVLQIPLGFADDNVTAYLQVSTPSGPDEVVALDTRSGERRVVARDTVADPRPIHRDGVGATVGVRFLSGKARTQFFDPQSGDANFHALLENAFPDSEVSVSSATRDGRLKLVLVASDIDPGSFYLFDSVSKQASFLLARQDRIDPAVMAHMRPVSLAARDGLPLHGYLTLPPGATPATRLPTVVVPHGGPFGIFDRWGFDADAQLLAAAGYAVLQVNFRGSGNYGRSFRQAGARQWGGTMQDDVTDATRWLVGQGIADPGRICIYGASYGAYAALMGVVREPDLYRCAAGYVGVYDLPKMRTEDGRVSRSMRTWSSEWVGTDQTALAAVSPNRLADRIKVPVLLAAGGEDEIAPIEHSRMMERALRGAGVPVETLYYPNEGHGFYKPENRRAYYTRLLAFLSTHLGGAAAAE
ncbi:S9 family peptidase [Luteimonas sp. BDR2-5]|uniref:alpha/beta hydrolase family protein n=1 Tax=Proluteimonas luteida TaxID=2878685 RepID=UPI001E3B8286|nr:S9 family peptidase [Luteimonas sp. BDR2-5]MCD9028204.1 S9 family peptidase [Luteimonas sp. BDR2-5]